MQPFSLRTLNLVHDWVSQVITPGDFAVDATVGNGHDTLFLAHQVGPAGHVYGMDVQAVAAQRTQALLAEAGVADRASLKIGCHSKVGAFIPQEIAVAMFNLGYLPKGDKAIITQEETTIPALQACLSRLKPKGLITIMCYPGHAGGETEASAVEAWAQQLETPHYLVMKAAPHNPRTPAPYLIAIQRNS